MNFDFNILKNVKTIHGDSVATITDLANCRPFSFLLPSNGHNDFVKDLATKANMLKDYDKAQTFVLVFDGKKLCVNCYNEFVFGVMFGGTPQPASVLPVLTI